MERTMSLVTATMGHRMRRDSVTDGPADRVTTVSINLDNSSSILLSLGPNM